MNIVNNNKLFYLTLIFLFFFTNITSGDVVDDNTQVPVTLQLKWINQFQFAGYYMALEKGYYKDAGLNVTILNAQKDENSIEQVLNGVADIGISSSDIVLKRAEGNPLVVLGVIFQHSPYVFLSLENSGISSIHDLAGKTIMMDSEANELKGYLLYEGVSLDSVKIKYNADFNLTELITGVVDVNSGYSTTDSFILQENGLKYQMFTPRASGIDFYGDNLFTTEKYLKKNPETIKKFLHASYKGWEYALDNQDETIDLLITKYNSTRSREFLQFEANQTKTMILPDVVQIGYMNPLRWEKIIQVYNDLGLLAKPVNVDSLLYNPKETKIPLEYILSLILLIILAAISTIAYLHYRNISQKLKKEVEERKIAECGKKESDNEINMVLNCIREIIFRMNNEGKYIRIAPTNLLLLGKPPEELLGKTLFETLPEKDAKYFMEQINTALKTQNRICLEHKFEIGGKITLYKYNIYPINDHEVILVVWDVTDIRKEEDNLLLANKRLNMLSGITRHDILNQINALWLYLDIALDDMESEELPKYIEKSSLITKTIESQIQFTKIYENIGSEVSLWQEVAIIIKKVEKNIPVKSIFKYHLNLDNICVYADPLLEKVFFTFVENTIRHGGKVTDLWFTYEIRGSELILIYEDNGIGIPDNEKNLIFNRGYGKNTGFGLFMAKEILSISNMTIIENGISGKGVRFEINVPLGSWKYHGIGV